MINEYFWKIVDDVKWFQKNNIDYLKVWISYENLKEFINFINISYERYVDCTLLKDGVYIEFDDIDVKRYFDYENVNEFIAHTGIEEY